MTDDAFSLREEVETLFASLLAEIDSKGRPNDFAITICRKLLAEGRGHVLARIQSGTFTAADWTETEAKFRRLVSAFTDPLEPCLRSPVQLEWIAFVEQLRQRQGTHMPDWSAFYAERDELDRKIQERGKS
jgi:hypothetical protein